MTAIVHGQMSLAASLVLTVLALKPLRVVAMLLTSVLLKSLLGLEPFAAGFTDMR